MRSLSCFLVVCTITLVSEGSEIIDLSKISISRNIPKLCEPLISLHSKSVYLQNLVYLVLFY